LNAKLLFFEEVRFGVAFAHGLPYQLSALEAD
jgi:hypothetical protein